MTINKSTCCWASRCSICVDSLVTGRGMPTQGMHGALANKLMVMASSCRSTKQPVFFQNLPAFGIGNIFKSRNILLCETKINAQIESLFSIPSLIKLLKSGGKFDCEIFLCRKRIFTLSYQSSSNFCYKLKRKWLVFFLKELSIYKYLAFQSLHHLPSGRSLLSTILSLPISKGKYTNIHNHVCTG